MTRMDTTLAPRLYETEADIISVGEGLLDCTLPKAQWTHEGHLAACLYLLLRRPEIDLPVEMPGIISRYNVAVGGENTDTAGYHETITQFYIRAVRAFAEQEGRDTPLLQLCNRLLVSELGDRNYPLNFWSKERLFSVPARRSWLEPDLQPLPF